ncbi:hypothetical protein EJB05_00127, partial [Eragrostis curvula]
MESVVVSASHGAMASLIDKLGVLLTDKYQLLKEAKGPIMFVKAELESMHAFQKKMADEEKPDELDKCWAKEVPELSYDIEDSINEFLHRVECESNSRPRGLTSFINQIMNLLTTINTRHQIANEFLGLKRRVMEVSERRTRYKVNDTVTKMNNTTIDLRLVAIYAESAGLVGIDGPRDELIQLMGQEGTQAHRLKVISIVGFGGLGKTTLANEIYRKLGGSFQCQAFKPNIRKILRTILSQAGFQSRKDNNMEIWEEFELISALRNFLLDKRYFIVIDDIWDASAWDIIGCALPENINGSRVITTTRIESVGRACSANKYENVYKMKSLCDEDSRRLFFKRIFSSEDACPPYLRNVSAEILKKCGGLPLAIITTSSLLASQSNNLKEQWEYVRRSMVSNFEMNPSLEGMREILNLSYINLPYHLKTCMLYLGIYPEDYKIYKTDLVRQWVAEGFISKFHGMDSKDVAKSYFNELINRSMIQPADTDYNGEVLSCRVHDMMLDLVLHKSREENFITVIDEIQDMAGHRDKMRRLSLHLDGATDDSVMGSIELAQVRMLARFGTSPYLAPFLLFKHLRVLTIEIEISRGFRSNALLDFTGICHLFQLRYLKIVAWNHPVVLPSKIGSLPQLETFHIESFYKSDITSYKGLSIVALPLDIIHMSRLLHLIVPGWRKLPDGMRNLKSLRTLRIIHLDEISPDNIKGLGELTNLTDFSFGCGSDDPLFCDTMVERGRKVLLTCLEKLCNLKYLEMFDRPPAIRGCLEPLRTLRASFCHLQRLRTYDTWFSRVPEWIGQLHNLYDLRLMVKEMLEVDVRILAQLLSLIHLDLHIDDVPKDKIIILGSGFPVVRNFRFACDKISCLAFEAGAMTKLERLELYFNAEGWDRYGSAAPAGLEHLFSLKEIYANIGGGGMESSRRAGLSALSNAINLHPGCPTANIQ